MNYKNKLLYSSKHITKKNRKLKYYYCVDFDGKTLIVEKVKNPLWLWLLQIKVLKNTDGMCIVWIYYQKNMK